MRLSAKNIADASSDTAHPISLQLAEAMVFEADTSCTGTVSFRDMLDSARSIHASHPQQRADVRRSLAL